MSRRKSKSSGPSMAQTLKAIAELEAQDQREDQPTGIGPAAIERHLGAKVGRRTMADIVAGGFVNSTRAGGFILTVSGRKVADMPGRGFSI